MQAKNANLLWGLALIAAGLLFLAQTLGIIPELSLPFWAIIFGAASLVFFAAYFINGVRQWGWLFPAAIFAGLAGTLAMVATGLDGSYVATPILASIAVPFVVVYAQDRRTNWWALIPAWTMAVITLVTLIAELVPGEIVGTVVLWGIGLPFLVVFLLDRSRRWALIPAGVLGAVGLIVLLSMVSTGDMMGALVMFIIAIPFVFVYFTVKDAWWAIIPAGVMGSIGLIVLVNALLSPNLTDSPLIGGLLFLGWAATFGVLWLLRTVHPTAWAKYPAIALAAVAVIIFLFGAAQTTFVAPLIIIVLGVALFYSALRRKPLA